MLIEKVEYLIGERQTGRTTTLVRMLAEDINENIPALLFVLTFSHLRSTRQALQQQGVAFPDHYVHTIEQATSSRLRSFRPQVVYIDDGEQIEGLYLKLLPELNMRLQPASFVIVLTGRLRTVLPTLA